MHRRFQLGRRWTSQWRHGDKTVIMGTEATNDTRGWTEPMAEQRKPVADAGFKLMNWTHRAVLGITGGR